MIIVQNSVTEICGEILQDILKNNLPEDCRFEGPTNIPMDTSSTHKDCSIKTAASLCNCTQTGEVKILVKKITDFENERHKLANNKNTCLLKVSNVVEDDKSNLTTNIEHCQKLTSENCQNDICQCQLTTNEPNCQIDTDELTENDNSVRVVDCQSGTICEIAKDNSSMEQMSDFLVKVCEKRQLRRLSTQEHRMTDVSEPYAGILEQGDYIVDTFHNLLTDNGNLTVSVRFSYCAKLLAVLLTLNTIFFSKFIIWDSFLQHLF